MYHYLVESKKTKAEVLAGSLNWLMSLSRSDADVLPSKPAESLQSQCVATLLRKTPGQTGCHMEGCISTSGAPFA